MENQTQPTIEPQIPVQSVSEQKTESKKPLPKLKLTALIILLLLILTIPFGGFLLLGKLGIHPKPSTITIKTVAPTTNPTPTKAPSSLSPNTGNLYGDIKVRLNEIIK
jgi:hypothetical protein